MATRMTSPFAGARWIGSAFNIGARNPKTLLLAALILVACAFVPSLVSMPLQKMYPGNLTVALGVMVFSVLVGLALTPMYAGFLRVIHAVETGQSVRSRDVFSPYRDGTWLSAIGFALLHLVLSIAALGIAVVASGVDWTELSTLAMSAQPGAPVQVPAGVWRLLGLATVVSLLLGGVWAVGYGQLAIARRSVFGALGDGFSGTLKNLVSVFLLMLMGVLLAIALCVVAFLVVMVVGLLAKIVGMWLGFVIGVPLYIAFLLGMYVVMFGIAYAMWRDVCGDPPPMQDVAVAQA